MEVELLNNNSGGILDLTKGAEPNEEKEAEVLPEGNETIEGAEKLPLEGEDTTPADEVDVPSIDVPESTDEPDSDVEYFFGEEQVNVEIPDEIQSALTEAGIDGKDIINQLFKKEGDFSLDEATRTKLEEKFGKHMVSGYLSMYKNMNEQNLKTAKADKEAQDATFEQQSTAYAEAVGGAEGIKVMEDYILNNLDENQIKSYNSVMENGDHESQMLVISQLRKTMELEDRLVNGDKKLELIGDKETSEKAGSPLDKGYLNREEYDTIMESDTYWKDRAYMTQVDEARLKGKRLGK